MAKKKRGRIVETKSGKIGVVYNGQKLVQGKVPVYLVNEDFETLSDKHGRPKAILCDPETLKLKGYVD